MSSIVPDPNNHLPGVTPGDSWDDTNECPVDGDELVPTLPRKRPASDHSLSEMPIENDHSGLRIEPDFTLLDVTETPRRLEVREISDVVIRLEEAVPAPPKAARKAVFHERAACAEVQDHPRGEDLEWGVADRKPILWLIGAGAVVAAIIILLILFLPAFNSMQAPRANPGNGIVEVEIEEKLDGVEAMNRLLVKQPEAMQIYRAFTNATHFDEIVPIIRNGASLKPTLRTAWRPMNISKQWAPAADSVWSLIELGDRQCAMLEGNFPDGSPYTAYFTNEDNRLLLDWKATTAYGTASFDDLAENKGEADEIRGLISVAQFYNDAWPEKEYQSFRLISPDGEKSIWCYSRRDDAVGAEIAQLFRKGEIMEELNPSRKITVRLERGPVGARPNQWLIREMLHIDWLKP